MTTSEESAGKAGSNPLGHLTSVVDRTGLPSTIRGRAQRWVVRFIAGTIAHPAFQEMRENLDTVEGRSRINSMVAEELGRRAIADPEYMERAKARFMGDWTRKHDNIEAVAAKALGRASAEPDVDLAPGEAQREPEPDWLNTLTRAAEDASSDELRERLAAILAGEARQPGSFSRATVRLVAELDKETLEGFQKLLEFRVAEHIPNGPDWDTQLLTGAIRLEEVGLVSGSSGFLSKSVTLDARGLALITADGLALVIKGEAGKRISYASSLLTTAGREISTILPPTDERAAIIRLSNIIDKDQLTELGLGTIIARAGAEVTVHPSEVLWKTS